MSHISKVNVQIKNVSTLKRAVESLGLVFNETQKTFQNSSYGSIPNCQATVHTKEVKEANGRNGAALVQDTDGKGFHFEMDNWNNQLTNAAGNNCQKLTQKYTELTVKDELQNNGFMYESAKVDQRTGDLVMLFSGE